MYLEHGGTIKSKLRDLSIYEKVPFSTEELLKLMSVVPEIEEYSLDKEESAVLTLSHGSELLIITKIKNLNNELYIIVQHKTTKNTQKYEEYIRIDMEEN